jgi:mono/diheme cytochrome c family protein
VYGFPRAELAWSRASGFGMRFWETCSMKRIALLILLIAVGVAVWILLPAGEAPEITAEGDPARGEYMLYAGGCIACHTDAKNKGPRLAGGRALATDFGTFYTPNITPDPETGIGGWSTGAFVRALKEGLSPGGQHYYPAFPYPSYAKMTEQDAVDLKAYLDSIEPISNEVPAHDLSFAFSFRPVLAGWKLLFFDDAPFSPDPDQSESWNRGAYLVEGPSHCGECHTSRNMLGGPETDRYLAGATTGPEGKGVPNITPHEDGIGVWSPTDITFALQTTILPDGDSLGGAMAEVVEDNTSKLTPEDRSAIAEYLLTVPPRPGPPKAAPAEGETR